VNRTLQPRAALLILAGILLMAVGCPANSPVAPAATPTPAGVPPPSVPRPNLDRVSLPPHHPMISGYPLQHLRAEGRVPKLLSSAEAVDMRSLGEPLRRSSREEASKEHGVRRCRVRHILRDRRDTSRSDHERSSFLQLSFSPCTLRARAWAGIKRI